MTKCSQALDLEHAPGFGACSELIFEVQRGLLTRPRSLAPWMFYDELGSGLFERITALPEYYLTRTESEIYWRTMLARLSRRLVLANNALCVSWS